jgi:isopenicillin N synthase-like dioxygenase
LQVEVSPDHWIDAAPLPGSFVVNIGELLELATNGYLRATVHRVVSPPAGQDRLSIAFSLAHNWTPWFPFTPCRKRWRVRRKGRKAIHKIPFTRCRLELPERAFTFAPGCRRTLLPRCTA